MNIDEGTNKIVLVISPHPDDESSGAPATLQLLHDAGWRIINVACSLGNPEQYDRRRLELEEACKRGGYESVVANPPALISRDDDLQKAQQYLAASIAEACKKYKPTIVISPHVHDRHHGHEVVARATRDGLLDYAKQDTAPVWWTYGTWGELTYPTLYVPFDQPILDRTLHILSAYEGENERNDYRILVESSARRNVVWASEAIFGFGRGRAATQQFAEVLSELVYVNNDWHEGAHRILNVSEPYVQPLPISRAKWLNSPSPWASQ